MRVSTADRTTGRLEILNNRPCLSCLAIHGLDISAAFLGRRFQYVRWDSANTKRRKLFLLWRQLSHCVKAGIVGVYQSEATYPYGG